MFGETRLYIYNTIPHLNITVILALASGYVYYEEYLYAFMKNLSSKQITVNIYLYKVKRFFLNLIKKN